MLNERRHRSINSEPCRPAQSTNTSSDLDDNEQTELTATVGSVASARRDRDIKIARLCHHQAVRLKRAVSRRMADNDTRRCLDREPTRHIRSYQAHVRFPILVSASPLVLLITGQRLMKDFPNTFQEGFKLHFVSSGFAGFMCSAASNPIEYVRHLLSVRRLIRYQQRRQGPHHAGPDRTVPQRAALRRAHSQKRR